MDGFGASDLDATLNELDRVLDDEQRALSGLDATGVLAMAARKAELVDELARGARAGQPLGAERARRLRERLLQNQRLLIHARDCVRGVLGPAEGRSRLSVRG